MCRRCDPFCCVGFIIHKSHANELSNKGRLLFVSNADVLNDGANDAADVGDDPPTARSQHPELSQCLTIGEDKPPSTDSQVMMACHDGLHA
jgi:hypothetical protein